MKTYHFTDLPPCARLDLLEEFRDFAEGIYESLKTQLLGEVAQSEEDLRDEETSGGDALASIRESIEQILIEEFDGEYARAVERLVDSFGLRGWEFRPPGSRSRDSGGDPAGGKLLRRIRGPRNNRAR